MPNQRVVPYLGYPDAPAALEFLCRAFGFEETFRYPMEDGRIGHGHAELTLNGDVALMVASSFPERGYRALDPEGHRWMFGEVSSGGEA